jgi:hypothetical protein
MQESAEIARANDVRFVEMSWVLKTNLHAIQGIELSGSHPIPTFPDCRAAAAAGGGDIVKRTEDMP